jgi:capsular polysaccharide biosynthesis protein
MRTKHKCPEAFVATLTNAAVIGISGAVMTSDRTILGDVSLEWYMPPERHSLMFRPRLHAPTHLFGTVATLALVSGNAYYHWMVDVLPRIDLLRRAGIPMESIDHFILNGGRTPFQKQTLAALNIDAGKCVFTGRGRHYRAETLIVPSRCGASGNPPKWVADFLRTTFLSADGASTKSDRIYISRRTARYRRLLNEDEVVARLKVSGFREVILEDMSFREQVNLFAGAEAVAGPHGGALTKIVFCRPGTKVLEFFSPHYVNECFWALGNHVGVDHYYLLGMGKRPPAGLDRQWGEWNIRLDLRKLDDILRLAGLD